MLKLMTALSLCFALACGAGSPSGPVPPPPVADMSYGYCNPCCKVLPCELTCLDCGPVDCAARGDGKLCCTKNRDPGDGGQLCPPGK